MKNLGLMLLCCGYGFTGTLAPTAANAALIQPIDFVFEATGSGSIGEQAFQDADFRIDITTDAILASEFSNSSTNGYRIFVVLTYSGTTATVSIDGIGTANILENLFLIANPNDYCKCVSIRPTSNEGDVLIIAQTPLDLQNPYDFTFSVGPVSGDFTYVRGPSILLDTDLGPLQLDQATQGAFTATTVPIPPAFVLLLSALGTLSISRRRLLAHYR